MSDRVSDSVPVRNTKMASTEDDMMPNFDIMVAFGLPVNGSVSTKKANNGPEEPRNTKIRFAEMATQELDGIVKDSQAKKTKQATQ